MTYFPEYATTRGHPDEIWMPARSGGKWYVHMKKIVIEILPGWCRIGPCSIEEVAKFCDIPDEDATMLALTFGK
jgi:hypothetical protein